VPLLAQQLADPAAGAAPWVFYPVAALAVAGALGVVLSGNIVRMAVALLFTLASVALLYFFLAAEFLAAIQLIVYVGGILILIIFGVMLTSKNPFMALTVPVNQRVIGWSVGLGAAVLMILLTSYALESPGFDSGAEAVGAGLATVDEGGGAEYGIRELGVGLLTKYVLPFELAGVLLLVVMIGAAYMAKGRQVDEGRGPDPSGGAG